MNEIEKKPRGNTAGCRGKEDPTQATRINVLLPGEINQMLINLQGKIMMLEGQKLSKQAVLIRLLNSMLPVVLVVLVSSCELNQEHIGGALQIVFVFAIFFIIRFIYLMVKTTKNKIK
jgi:hypothetical protein